jgi:hypothetical protein
MWRDEFPLAELDLRAHPAFLLLGRRKDKDPPFLLTGVTYGTLIRRKSSALILLIASVLVQFLEDGRDGRRRTCLVVVAVVYKDLLVFGSNVFDYSLGMRCRDYFVPFAVNHYDRYGETDLLSEVYLKRIILLTYLPSQYPSKRCLNIIRSRIC